MAYGENHQRFSDAAPGDAPAPRRAARPAPSASGSLGSPLAQERPVHRGAHVRRSGVSREVIDARGSIDSRTFNETHEISSTTKDVRDRHAAELDSMSHTSWHSRAGQGFDAVPDAGAARRIAPRPPSNIGFSGGVMSSGPNYGRPGASRLLVPVLLLVAVVLVAVVLFLLLR